METYLPLHRVSMAVSLDSITSLSRKQDWIVSNSPDIFHHYFDINPIQVADGVMEYLPTIAVPDPTLQKYVTALEALIEYHRIREFSWKL